MYKIELEPTVTILQAKQRFVEETQIGDAANMKMILKAKLLGDDATIGSLNLGEKDFIVVHAGGKKPAPKATPPPAAAAAPAPAPAVPSPGPLPVGPAPTPTTAPLPEITRPQPTQPAGGFPGGGMPGRPGGQMPQQPRLEDSPEFESNIQQLIEIGYPRSECEAALRAAYGNPDRAAEYLMNGSIPDDEDQQAEEQSMLGLREIAQILSQNPGALENFIRIFEQQSPVFRQQPEQLLTMLNLDPANFDCEAIRNRTAQPVDQAVLQQSFMQAIAQNGGMPGMPQPGMGGAAPGGFPGFQPSGVPPTAEVGQPMPGGMPSGPAQVAPNPMGSLLAQFSEEEKEAIQRLQQLGNFPLPLVVQCYNACDKNEELAANLLFQMND